MNGGDDGASARTDTAAHECLYIAGAGGADFADALILNIARLTIRELDRPFEGLYTFDAKTLSMPGTEAP